MHRTDDFPQRVVDNPAAIAARQQARTRGEAAEMLIAVTAAVTILGTLAGWRLPI